MKRIIRLTESDLTRIVKRVLNEDQDYSDPTRYKFPDVNKVLGHLIGKTATLNGTGSDDLTIKIDGVSANKNKVFLDGDVTNEYGESKGGIFGSGLLNNIEVSYHCFKSQPSLGDGFFESNGRWYYNEGLNNEIMNNYCKKITPIQKPTTDY